MIVDLCMWTLNGEKYLPLVFKRIDEVIPQNFVNKKILVDDGSIDKTVDIAKKFGWTVYDNLQGGYAGGFNEAVKHVETEFFCSFEQDVILNRDWFKNIQHYMANKDVVVAQGIRLPSHRLLRAFYVQKLREQPRRLMTSLDNNIYRTEKIREIGGFPSDSRFIADVYLLGKIIENGWRWVVDRNIVSIHIREGIKKQISHFHAAVFRRDFRHSLEDVDTGGLLQTFVSGLVRCYRIGFNDGLPQVFVVYPYMSLMNLKLYLQLKIMKLKRPVLTEKY